MNIARSLAEEAETGCSEAEMRSLLRNLSALMAMMYRRAPLPVSPNLVRRFAGQEGPDMVLELGGVLRRCLLLGDDTVVLGELRKHALGTGKISNVCSNIERESPSVMMGPGSPSVEAE